MTFDPIDTGPEAARAALDASRLRLCAQVAALQAQPDPAFIAEFPAVVAAVEAGFRHEEMLLDRLGDVCLRTRRADDAVILCALHRVMPCIERGDVALGRQVAAALAAVLSLRPAFEAALAHDAQAAAVPETDGSCRVRPQPGRRSAAHTMRVRQAQRLS
jgi:hypothetical protein